MPTELVLTNGGSSAVLSSRGAELMSWRVAGREMIWNGDARWWPRRAPILFPFNGWLNGHRFRAKGTTYETPVHGFGPGAEFRLDRVDDAAAILRLTDTEQTHAVFPFAFEVTVNARLDPDGMDFQFEVRNPASEVLPFSIGFHPGFVSPFDGGDPDAYEIVFEKAEAFDIPRIAPGGLFTDQPLDGVPMRGARLNVAAGLARQESLCFRHTASRRLEFVAPSGRRLAIESEGFAHWVIWRRPGGAYLCIEGWSGHGDPVGFVSDITEKPGMTLLPPGDVRRYRFRFRFV
ncbi:MAG TPA: aldose 1-epimerase family protein [Beijerinckiaceae bacterium]|nr:aldose 1-epimerase family protein [Beijerinckiaceae bacterium]